MSVADDYPAVAILHDAWTSRDRAGEKPPQAVQMFDELKRLRVWKHEATVVLRQLEEAWESAGKPGRLGRSKATSLGEEVQRLRDECAAWMNGVADAVEQYGYDRVAASGPSDLLPGIADVYDRGYNAGRVDGRKDADRLRSAAEAWATWRLSRNAPWSTPESALRVVVRERRPHFPIVQQGSNLCVCGFTVDHATHDFTPQPPVVTDDGGAAPAEGVADVGVRPVDAPPCVPAGPDTNNDKGK